MLSTGLLEPPLDLERGPHARLQQVVQDTLGLLQQAVPRSLDDAQVKQGVEPLELLVIEWLPCDRVVEVFEGRLDGRQSCAVLTLGGPLGGGHLQDLPHGE